MSSKCKLPQASVCVPYAFRLPRTKTESSSHSELFEAPYPNPSLLGSDLKNICSLRLDEQTQLIRRPRNENTVPYPADHEQKKKNNVNERGTITSFGITVQVKI